jgi:ABC-type dipeptide/oligopeptide/nickel transport system ATPase component
MSQLKLSGLYVTYGRAVAVNNLSLEIPAKGYTLGLVGESGSGKTTVGLGILNVIEPPGQIVSGSIEFENEDVLKMDETRLRQYRWKQVAMVHQSAMNSLSPVKRVSDHIVQVIREHLGDPKKEAREKAIRLLEEVGIEEGRADGYPHEFSGGMRQRVAVAMALALSPKLLIADEPTSALDVVVQRQILSMLKETVTKNGQSLIFITHELAILKNLVDNVAVMRRGRIVELGPTEKVLFDPRHPYTQMLVNSVLPMNIEREDIRKLSVTIRQKRSSLPVIEKPIPLKEVERGRWAALSD